MSKPVPLITGAQAAQDGKCEGSGHAVGPHGVTGHLTHILRRKMVLKLS
ncbi:hypothetical protein OQJ46_16300 [Microbulbifer thermotolerans]|nr:hypothetical protein [Microbulbifer thermotolerans]MCX2784557.1 hypothetical protein [Microbulbifer thermotolerans]